MAKIKRIISDQLHSSDPKTVADITREAIYIPFDDHNHVLSTEEIKWDQVGRPLFGVALKQILPKIKHDTKENPSS